MSFIQILSTVFEFLLVSFTVWAVFHEDRFIAFEEKIMADLRRKKLKVVKENSVHNSAFNC
ncbi:MAG: hypothetical protein MJ090_02720 [Clostridia bacterium]|nr:hypothetical protein [Clostridia bacterium]